MYKNKYIVSRMQHLQHENHVSFKHTSYQHLPLNQAYLIEPLQSCVTVELIYLLLYL